MLVAAAEGHISVVRCLCDARADLHSEKKGGVTPLIAAGFRRQHEVFAFLKARGADQQPPGETGVSSRSVPKASAGGKGNSASDNVEKKKKGAAAAGPRSRS